jgi:cysteine synthase
MNRIGNTPLFRLEQLPEAGSAEVYVKWEGANPPAA